MKERRLWLSSVTVVGLDLAKHVFQVHGVDASGRVVVAKAIRRNKLLEFFASLPPCLVGLEACGSAHHWARDRIDLHPPNPIRLDAEPLAGGGPANQQASRR